LVKPGKRGIESCTNQTDTVLDTVGKFAAGIVGTGGKFANGINNSSKTGGKIFTPVSLIPVANLPPVPLIPVVHLDLRISTRIFEKI
jgi:hypothetical protein